MKRIGSTATTIFLGFAAIVLTGCETNCHREVLRDYYRFNTSSRLNLPSEYISFLKKQDAFRGGNLDNLPPFAVILYSDPVTTLGAVGIGKLPEPLEIGTATPEHLYVLKTSRGLPFMLIQGQAGAGGVTTIASELVALGATHVVHIGTCAALTTEIPARTAIVSTGSYKDSAGILLSDAAAGKIDPIAYPSSAFSARLSRSLAARKVPQVRALGFTTPIYYFEPSGLYKRLSDPKHYAPTPKYIEMEQGSFFASATQMKVEAASIVVAGDRYRIENGELAHEFLDSPRPTIEAALAAVLDTFDDISLSKSSLSGTMIQRPVGDNGPRTLSR